MLIANLPVASPQGHPDRLRLFVGVLPMGLNSSSGSKRSGGRRKGLLNAHWTEYQAAKKTWAMMLANAVPSDFPGFGVQLLKLTVVRFGPAPLDRDNLWSSMKMIFDGLISAKVLRDDSERCTPMIAVEQVVELNRDRQGLLIDVRPLTLQEIAEYEDARRLLYSLPRPFAGHISGEFSPN